MNAEKLKSLTKYIEELKYKIADLEVPPKHAKRPEQYRAFLKRELWLAERSVAKLKGL